MPDVVIDGKKVRLPDKDLVGRGGEGNVYKLSLNKGFVAVKLYHDATFERAEKLNSFLSQSWNLPTTKIALPLNVASDLKGKVIGFVMPYLGTGFEDVAKLGNKKYRNSFSVNTKDVAEIFLDGLSTLTQIHANSLVVGDLNDLNVLFRGHEMLWIDADAWQFGKYVCPVATETFLDPALYGVDLSKRMVFKPVHDWYSYAVMLFKSLLLVHPYGGTHQTERQLTHRAAKKISVLDANVTYPQIGYGIDVLNKDMLSLFEKYFAKGERFAFPRDTLLEYKNSLIECPSCGFYYPAAAGNCPVCAQKTIVVITKPQVTADGKQVTVTEIVKTQGKILLAKILEEKVVVLAAESGKLVLYTKNSTLPITRKVIMNEEKGARYEILDNILFILPAGSDKVYGIEISGVHPKGLLETQSSIFALNRRSIFRTSKNYYFRLGGANLLKGTFDENLGVTFESTVCDVAVNQTWFTSDENEVDGVSLFGFFQVGSDQIYWLAKGNSFLKVNLAQLAQGEALTDISAKFSSQGVLVRRISQLTGIDYLTTEMLDNQGTIIFHDRTKREDHQIGEIHGQAYMTGVLLHATDEGIVQEKVREKTFKTFDRTKGLVKVGDSLKLGAEGIFAVSEDTLRRIQIG